jgi:hypothetical protein
MSIGKGGRPFVDQFGRRYETQSEAARLHDLAQSNIWKNLNGRVRRCGKFVFTYL